MFNYGSLLAHQNVTHCKTLWPTNDIFLSSAYVVVNVALIVIGAATNCVLLLGLYKSKLTSQNTMMVIYSLAFSDFCVSALVMPTFLVAIFQREKDCSMHLMSVCVFMTFAINTANMLLILSTDRLLQVSWPILYRAHITKKRMKILIICAWIVSPISAVSILFTSPVTQVCILLTIGMAFYTISVASYVRILFVVHTHRKKIQASFPSGRNNEAAREKYGGSQESARRTSKTITFKLQVEVFGDSPKRSENVRIHTGETRTMAQESSRLNGTYDGTDHKALLTVPEEPKMEKDHLPCHGKMRGSNFQHEQPEVIAVEDITDKKVGQNINIFGSYNKKDGNGTANLKPDCSSRKRPSRHEPVGSNGKDPNATISLRREMKVTWTVAMVIVTLFVCYIPYIWSAFLWAFEEYKHNRHTSKRLNSTYAWTLSIAFLHSTVNPIIIIARNTALRSHVKSMFTALFS